ncbi:hypothetical protein [Klebsiella variicola]|uniref:hypothetical protein n=1 Tax=Klebsiella variicola TaxID=244366 RepID=UPI000E3C67CA|nr:hypothetical protein [Klebsiella variicola]
MESTYGVFVKFAAEDKLTRTLNDLIKKTRQLDDGLKNIPKTLRLVISASQQLNNELVKTGKGIGIASLVTKLKESDKLLGANATSATRLGEAMKLADSRGGMSLANKGLSEYQQLLVSTKGSLESVIRLQREAQRGLKIPATKIPASAPASSSSSGGGRYSWHEAGMNNLMTSYAGFDFLNKSYDVGIDYARDQARLRQMGLNQSQMAQAISFVANMKMPYTSQADMMRIFTDAQGSFRQTGMGGNKALEAAMTMAPLLANYEAAMGALSGDSSAAASFNMRNLNKIVEIMGGTAPGQQDKAKAIVDAVFKASQASGRLVDESQLRQFVAYGSSATNQQSIKSIFAWLEPVIAEMGGSTTAVGLRTAYTRMNGMMSLPPKLLQKEMKRLGIADKTGRKQNESLYHLQATDVFGYSQKLMEIYKLHGITKATDIERENSILFGTNGAKIYNRLMAQMATLIESGHSYDVSQGPEQTIKNPLNKSIMGRQALATKWSGFQLALAQDGGVLDMATKGIDKLTEGLNRITTWMRANPNATKYITEVGTGIIGLAGAGGAMWLLSGSLKGLISPFRLLYKPLSMLVDCAPLAASGMKSLYSKVALLSAADGIPLAISRLGLFGAAIGAAGLAGYAVYELYKRVKFTEPAVAQWNEVSKGSARFNVTNPNALDEYRHLLNPNKYPDPKGSSGARSIFPDVPSYKPNISLEVKNYIDNKEVSSHVIKTVVKEASRPPSGVSGVDGTMSLLPPGMGSYGFRG